MLTVLKKYIKYAPSYAIHSNRNAIHYGGNKDQLAPYYFFPTLPYGVEAIQEMLKNAKDDKERKELEEMADTLKTYALAKVNKETGLFMSMGQEHYTASPAYINPLGALSLLPFIKNCR